MDLFILALFIFILTLIIYFAFFYFNKSKKISKEKILEFRKILKKISSNISIKEKIFDSDKLYHKILLSYGYIGTFGEILKQNPKIIDNINSIWELHKLRNKIAHDLDIIEEKILLQKSRDYIKEIEKLLKNIT